SRHENSYQKSGARSQNKTAPTAAAGFWLQASGFSLSVVHRDHIAERLGQTVDNQKNRPGFPEAESADLIEREQRTEGDQQQRPRDRAYRAPPTTASLVSRHECLTSAGTSRSRVWVRCPGPG